MNKELKLRWKLYIQLRDKYLHFSFHKLFASQAGHFFVFLRPLLDESRPKVLLRNNSKTVLFSSIMILFQKSVSTWQFPGKQSNVWSFAHAEKRPLATCVWTCIDSWRYRISYGIGGWNAKTPALKASAPSPFSFWRFSPPPPPFFCACHPRYNL